MRDLLDAQYYYCGQSHYCNDCNTEFTPEYHEDDREDYLGLSSSNKKQIWESDEDYEERMNDLDDYYDYYND